MVPCVKYIFVQKPLRVDDSVHFKMFDEPRAHWLHNCRKKNGYYVSQNVHKGSVVRMRENFPQVGLNVGDLVTVDSVPECGGKLLKVILGSGGGSDLLLQPQC